MAVVVVFLAGQYSILLQYDHGECHENWLREPSSNKSDEGFLILNDKSFSPSNYPEWNDGEREKNLYSPNSSYSPPYYISEIIETEVRKQLAPMEERIHNLEDKK